MNLVPWKSKSSRWEPFREITDIQQEMNRLFNTSLSRWPNFGDDLFDGSWGPACDIYDSKDSVLVKADLPGMKKEDIDITIENNVLTISGKKEETRKDKDKNYLREERYSGSFTRAIPLPSSVDSDRVKAHYKDGVLELTLPKKEEAKPKQITIDVK